MTRPQWTRVCVNRRKRQSYPQKSNNHDSHDFHRSGQLNDKTRQLMELQALAAQKFAEMQASFAEGIKTARDVQKDLEWTQKKVEYVLHCFPALR